MNSNLPWIVYSTSDGFYRIVCRFGPRPEAEMHSQRLNRLASSVRYQVCWDKAVKISA